MEKIKQEYKELTTKLEILKLEENWNHYEIARISNRLYKLKLMGGK